VNGQRVLNHVPWTLADAVGRLRRRELSSVELTRAYLDRIDRFDGRLGAYVTRLDDDALAAADTADRALDAGGRGRLLGVPIAIKDIIATREANTWSNSEVDRPEWTARRDAQAVARLRSAGAVILGKLTTNEYALGGPDPGKRFPVPHNPWNVGRTAGGSSSGSAIAVAAGLCAGALGTDTGGSVRVPCAFNGVTGLLPTFGRVPADGVVPLAWSMDRVGPMARTAQDCAVLTDVLTAAPAGTERPSTYDLTGLRVGIVNATLATTDTDPAAVAAMDTAGAVLAGRGAQVSAVTLPRYDQTVAAAVLSLFGEAFDAHRDLLADHWGEYGRETRLALVRGAFVSAADYTRAQRVRALVQRELADVFARVDVLIMPTVTIGAPERAGLFESDVLRHVHTFYWNAVSNPVLAAPGGFTAERMPIGLQFVAAPFQDDLLLAVGQAFQSMSDHHLAVPAEVAV